MIIDKSTAFWDTDLSEEQRIDWLLKNMTIEEKINSVTSSGYDLERLGIPGTSLGGEAAHGVEGRNDQNGIGKADITTSFPQPIGMSASFDKELIREAGNVTGKEARATFHRHPKVGLSRWAPTVDLERDPRWGRNEEGYGEDPVLTGAMAGNYVRGMQGDDPYYVQCAATLKHFYGNNTEVGRGWKNSSIDPRNEKELYLEPFRRCIEEGGALGVMTAYNKVNGTVGVLNHEVRDILKKQYGLTHAVSDGGATELVVTLQHEYGLHSESVAEVFAAGVDAMSDNPMVVRPAVAEAYELGLITEDQLNEALRNAFKVKLRLGFYDRENKNPYDKVTDADVDSAENREICRRLTEESVVLLKNQDGFLPIGTSVQPGELALIGPMADAWYMDWYGGIPPYKRTLKNGLAMTLKNGDAVPYTDGYDRVVIKKDGRYVVVNEDNLAVLGDAPEVYRKENWGEGHYMLRCERTGKYLGVRMPELGKEGAIAADREEAFDWFVTEILHIEEKDGGKVALADRFHYNIKCNAEGALVSSSRLQPEEAGDLFEIETVEDGAAKAAALAAGKKTVILALGSNSMVNAKEEIDRNTLTLPPDQIRLAEEIAKVNKDVVLVLFTNYPYTLEGVEDKVPAIIMSATGSQDMGTAMADALFGKFSPAGRLNMTWYRDISQLPSIDDYDIIKGKRTYRYFDGPVLYPFGYGLTYSSFDYSRLKVQVSDDRLLVSFHVTNTGNRVSDEVAQVYAKAPASRVKKPLRQLIGFTRLHTMVPGEDREVTFNIPVSELRFYDVISSSLMVEEGKYTFFAGGSSVEEASCTATYISGEKTGSRDITKRIAADHYDEYENAVLESGHIGYKAMVANDREKEAVLVYRDCRFGADIQYLQFLLKSAAGGCMDIYIDDVLCGSWAGDTLTCEHRGAPKPDRYAMADAAVRNSYRHPNYEQYTIPVDASHIQGEIHTIKLVLKGDVRLCFFRQGYTPDKGTVKLGQAN